MFYEGNLEKAQVQAKQEAPTLQVEEEDERKKDSGRAHEVELLNLWAAAALSFYRHK